jgi:hypothetical protein
MDSSKVAFVRFFKWKKSMILVNVTVDAQSGTPDVFRGQQIFFVDEEEQVVAFVDALTHDHFRLDFRGADFVIRESSVEAARPNEGRVVIDEVLLS